MKLFILGGSGATGTELLRLARAQGHHLTAYVRDPAAVEPADAGVDVVTGNVTDVSALAHAMAGHDAVISMLGSGRKTTPLIADSTTALVPAAHQAGIRRVVVLSAFGVGDSLSKAGPVARLAYRTITRGVFADKARGEATLKASDLDWTLAYPVTLNTKPGTGHYTATRLEDTDSVPGMPSMARADVAAFLLEAATTGSFSRETAVLR